MFQSKAWVKGQVDVDTSSDFTATLVADGLSIVDKIPEILIPWRAVFTLTVND